MVTYTKGGTTPGDTYVWLFDEKGNPKSFKMWVDLIPIGGLEASWNDWILTDSKIKLPTVHKIGPLELEIDQIVTKSPIKQLSFYKKTSILKFGLL